ncbi:hypothetical protein [Azospirillum sp. ST 5-10]|uniref:hypothetical protein n=1 Tax=unclassified Azospirillum TaxID=2630922 RepID=UPI003F4A36D5
MAQHGARFDIGHPAPERHKAGPWLLFVTLFGAPLAWTLQLLVNSSIAGLACLTGTGARADVARWAWADPVIVAVNLVALVAAGVAFLVALRSLRLTHGEEAHRSGGVMDAGEGRTRVLAIWGLWSSVLFFLAIAANTVSVFWGGLCAT